MIYSVSPEAEWKRYFHVHVPSAKLDPKGYLMEVGPLDTLDDAWAKLKPWLRPGEAVTIYDEGQHCKRFETEPADTDEWDKKVFAAVCNNADTVNLISLKSNKE